MMHQPNAHVWPFPPKRIKWVRLLARLCSPLAIAWYLLTRRELSVQIRTFALDIEPRVKRSSNGWIVWSKPDESEFRHLFGFKYYSAINKMTFAGIEAFMSVLRLQFKNIFFLSASSLTEPGSKLLRLARLRLFSPLPEHGETKVYPHITPVRAGPIEISFWLHKPNDTSPLPLS